MRKYEYLKHLDRAFTEMPPELSDQIELTFRRGEKAVKQRHKIMTAISVAAVLAVLFAAIALAAGTLVKPRVDRVVASQRDVEGNGLATPGPETWAGDAVKGSRHPGATRETFSGDTVEDALAPDTTPEAIAKVNGVYVDVTPTSLSASEVIIDEVTFYATMYGQYYHLDELSAGMHNALPCALNTVQVMGKRACPTCVKDAVPELTYFATEQGQYYHVIEDCSGMLSAYSLSEKDVAALGRPPCPECLPAAPT